MLGNIFSWNIFRILLGRRLCSVDPLSKSVPPLLFLLRCASISWIHIWESVSRSVGNVLKILSTNGSYNGMAATMVVSMVVKTTWMVVTISSAIFDIFFSQKLMSFFKPLLSPFLPRAPIHSQIYLVPDLIQIESLWLENLLTKNENWWEILKRCQILSWIVLTWESFFKWEVMRDGAKVPNRLQATMPQKGNFKKSHYLLIGKW